MEAFKITFEYLELSELWCCEVHYDNTFHRELEDTKEKAFDKICKFIKFLTI